MWNNRLVKNFKSDDYRLDKTYDERKKESVKVRQQYPQRIPVICQKANSSTLSILGKKKYLVPKEITVSQFLFVIRKRLQLPSEKGLFLFVSNTVASSSSTMTELYDEYKNSDGFLYISYSEESVFGN